MHLAAFTDPGIIPPNPSGIIPDPPPSLVNADGIQIKLCGNLGFLIHGCLICSQRPVRSIETFEPNTVDSVTTVSCSLIIIVSSLLSEKG